eukprot:3854176-Amphidinium_carterae.1
MQVPNQHGVVAAIGASEERVLQAIESLKLEISKLAIQCTCQNENKPEDKDYTTWHFSDIQTESLPHEVLAQEVTCSG